MGTRLRSLAAPTALGGALLVLWSPTPNLPRGAATLGVALLAGLVGRFRWLVVATVIAAVASGLLWLIVNDLPAVVVGATLSRLAALACLAAAVGNVPRALTRRRVAVG